MRIATMMALLVACCMAALAQTQPSTAESTSSQNTPVITVPGPVVADYGKNIGNGNSVEDKIAKEVRHELLMLPYYTLFDDLGYSVQGRSVTLTGTLTSQNAITKNQAENSVKRIEGVEKVVNNIQVLPPSPLDDRIRRRTYDSLMRTGGLSKYFWEAAPSIHIISRNGHVTLAGFVMNEMDKNMAGIAAKTVPGVFSVTNDLRVVKG